MKTNKADVKLVYTGVGQGGEWKMAVGMGHATGAGHYPKLRVDKYNDGQFSFHINTSNRITFAKDNPIEFSKDGVPLSADELAQFSVFGAGTDTLVVKDSNTVSVPTEYYYKLNFDGAQPLDPIVANGCCSSKAAGDNFRLTSEPGVEVAIIGTAVLIVIVMVVARAKARNLRF